MTEILITVFSYLVNAIDHALAEASIGLFIVGIIFISIGLFLITGTLYTLIKGQRVDGVVIGAIKDVRIYEKEKGGKIIEKREEWLNLIYEYDHADGSTKQVKAATGGSSVLKYKTGQKVKLNIYRHKGIDEVNDIEDRSPFIIGGIFFCIGIIITLVAANLYASVGASILALLGIFISLILRGKRKGDSLEKKNHSEDYYDPAEIRPIEEFARESEL